jgi:hypothetical protein
MNYVSPWSRENSVCIPSYIIPRGSIKGLIPHGIQRAALKYGPIGPDLLHCTSKHTIIGVVLRIKMDLLVLVALSASSAFPKTIKERIGMAKGFGRP